MTHSDLTAFALARAAQTKALKRRQHAKSRTLAHTVTAPDYSPSQHTGFNAEAAAADFLTGHGLKILAHNLRCRSGEIDLIANDFGILVFIEVKYRRGQGYGGAAASVNREKQTRLIRSARFFLPAITRLHFAGRTPQCRFDVIAMEASHIDWIRHAFSAG